MTMYGTAGQDCNSLLSRQDTHRLPEIVVFTGLNFHVPSQPFPALSREREPAHALHRDPEDNISQIVEGSVIAHIVLHINSLMRICMSAQCGPVFHLQGNFESIVL